MFSSSECLCIHEDNPGLKDVFEYIPKYKSKEKLVYLIDYYLYHEDEAKKIIEDCRTDTEKLKFKYVVDNMLKRIING